MTQQRCGIESDFERRGQHGGSPLSKRAHFMQVENSDEPKPARNMEVHLLSNITIFGIQYNHIIVIESALYLY